MTLTCVALGAVACSSSSTSTPPGPSVPPLSAQMAQVPDGVVKLVRSAATSGAASVAGTVKAYGLPASATLTAALRRGNCLRRSAQLLTSLGTVTTDASGRTDGKLTPGTVSGAGTGSFTLSIGDTPRPADVVACTDLTTSRRGSQSLRIYPVPGQRASGTTRVSYDHVHRTLTIVVEATSLIPNQKYAGSLDSGSCAGEHKVVHQLADMVADASTTGKSVTTIKDVADPPTASGWLVLLDATAPPQHPVLCGDLAVAAATTSP